MKIKNLVPHIVTGETENSFVGIKIIDNQIHFYYPESYHFDPDNYERDDILDLLKTIHIAKTLSKEQTEVYDSRQVESDDALFSYIWILNDYLRNGYYINFERVLKTNQKGRINWKRTLQQQPLVSGQNVIYTNLYAEVKSPQDNMLVEAHRYCVKKSTILIGWLFGVAPGAIEAAPNADRMVPVYLDAIRSELDRTFDDEKHSRLAHMENVLIGLDEAENDSSIVFGADNYYYIFERMIDSIFGTEKADEYYPKFKWNLKYASKEKGLSGPTIRPDTIMKDGLTDDIYIIDSKFYRYGSMNLSKTKGLPEAASIVKQVTYGAYVKSEHPDNTIYNVFILPYDAKSPNAEKIEDQDKTIVYVGNVYSEWETDKTYGRVHTFLIDLKHVVKTWNRTIHDADRKNLISKVQQNIDNHKENACHPERL